MFDSGGQAPKNSTSNYSFSATQINGGPKGLGEVHSFAIWDSTDASREKYRDLRDELQAGRSARWAAGFRPHFNSQLRQCMPATSEATLANCRIESSGELAALLELTSGSRQIEKNCMHRTVILS